MSVRCSAADVAKVETAPTHPRQISVGSHGTLEITLPADWQLVQTNAPDKPALIHIQAATNHINIQMTIYWDGFVGSNSVPTVANFETIISNVVSSQYVPASVEKQIHMETLTGPAVTGRFVRFTDIRWFAQQKPETEFNNVATGMFRCDNLWGNFDLFTNDKNGPDFQRGFQVLKSLRKAQ